MTTTTLPFTQADGNLSGWTAFPGSTTLHVASNALNAPVTSTQYGSTLASGLVFTTYGSLQLDVTQTNGVVSIGFFDTGTNNGYIAEWSTTAGLRMRRLDGGVATTIATGSNPSTGTHTLKFEKIGATCRFYLDGTLDNAAVDATYATNATMAMTVLQSGGTTTADNFIYSNDLPAAQVVYVKEVGSVTNTTGGTTSAITVATGGVPVGDIIVILGSCDNTGASGAATTISAADNHAGTTNAYTLQTPQAIAVVGGATNSGAQGFMLVCSVTTLLSAGDTITITYGNSTTAKAINAQQFTGANTTTPVLSGSYAHQDNQTSTTNSVAGTPTVAGQMVVALIAVEGGTADSFTQDADTTDGLWVPLTRRGSGTTTSGQTLNSVYKPVTGTSAQTYNPTLGTARDHCAALLILDVPSSGKSGTVAVTLAATTSAVAGASSRQGTVARTLAATTSAAAGASTHVGTLARTLASTTVAAAGASTRVGTVAVALAATTCAASGTVGQTHDGTVAVTLANVTSSAVATSTRLGSVARTMGNTTSSSAGASTRLGTVARTLAATTSAAAGAPTRLGTVARTLANTTCAASGTVNAGSFFEPFTQADGNLGNGWVNDSGVGGSDPIVYVISNKGSTHSNTGFHVAIKTHGVDVSGDWQIDFDCDTSLVVGQGGVQVSLRDSTNFRGYGVFIGNAVHVQVYDAVGGSSNITNDGRPGEGSGHLANHVTMTHTAAGAFAVYLDGVGWSSASDTSQDAGAADYIVISIYSSASPTTEATIDNLGLQDFIGVPPIVGTVAVTLAATTSAAAGKSTHVGTVARTLGSVTSAAAGAPTRLGTVARTLADTTSASSGTVGQTHIGTVAVTLGNVTSSAAGAPTRLATVTKTLANTTSAASGTVGQTHDGTVAVTLANVTASATGAPTRIGTVARTLAATTCSASGSSGSAKVGTVAVTLASTTSSASGTPTRLGTVARTLGNTTSAVSGTPVRLGTVARTLGNVTSAASGSAVIVGTVAVTLAPALAAAQGGSTHVGIVAAILANTTCLAYEANQGPFPATSTGEHRTATSVGAHVPNTVTGDHLVATSTGGHTP